MATGVERRILNRVDESTNKHWLVAFVATSKAVLTRVLRENGVDIEPHAQRALGALPGTFGEWLAERGAGQQP